jgi:MYXO-CTERM domain-containing protein
VFTNSRRLNLALSLLFVFIMGSCGNGGLGCGCASQPLPGGALPADQTVEGGAQVRVTPSGMTRVNQLIEATLRDAIGGGFCVNQGGVGGSALGFDYCTSTNPAQGGGGSCGASPGCNVVPAINTFAITPVDSNTLNVRVQIDINAAARLNGDIAFIPFSCTLGINANDLIVDANLDLGIRGSDGELTITLAQINNTDFSGTSFSGCSVLSDILDLVIDMLDSFIGEFIIDLFTPTLNDLVQGFLPDPLGIEGLIDVGAMLEGVSPGTEALMEGRLVPGGYVNLGGGGMTLGVITGFNADEDIATRTTDLDSEPSLCVPPIPAPNFAAPPASLPITSRSTFTLAAAGAFSGAPDPAATDLAFGMSETTLDLAGHHLVTSGAMCMGVGTTTIDQLNLGTIGILVPSAAELGSDGGRDPLLLVLRPQRAVDFTVGDGTAAAPNLTLGISNLEVDFYAFLYERYTRLFTLSLTLNVGINLMVDNAASPPTLTPMLMGLSSDQIQLRVSNSEFVRETPADLEAILPTVFDLALPLLANGLDPIEVPAFAGFDLTNLRIGKVTTAQDDFLGIFAGLTPGAMMRTLASDPTRPALAEMITGLDRRAGPAPGRARGQASLREIRTPAPADVRAALLGKGGAMPTVLIDVDSHDAGGRTLEWSYRLGQGLWRPFQTSVTGQLAIADRAFAWQGKYELELVSRAVGDDRTLSDDVISIPVIIDSVAPAVHEAKVAWVDGDLVVPAADIVTDSEDLQFAFAGPDADQPATTWQTGRGRLARAQALAFMGGAADGELTVFVRDEVGNVQIARVSPFHGQAGAGGCSCDAGTSPSSGGVLLAMLTAGLVLVRRRRPALARLARQAARGAVRVAPTLAIWFGLSVAASLTPGCDCGNDPGTRACEISEDCVGFCSDGDIGFCIDNTCICSDDIPAGRIGPYSDIGASPLTGDTWVSAYAQSHGDLVVAHVLADGRIADTTWEWVDGVPDVAPVVPGAMIRGGIDQAGDDVGMYTSIAVGSDGLPRVSYFDREHASLRFATRAADGTWQKHDVDVGGGDVEVGGTVTGMYTSLSLRADGRPAIGYMAHVNQGGNLRAEVRYAFAASATPASPADWTVLVVDTVALPALPEPDAFPLPRGLGLFVDMARDAMEVPVLVYYDRQNGDLKMTKFDTVAGTFPTPTVIDGSGDGNDAGWSPTVGVDTAGKVHLAYVSATRDDLIYRNVTDNQVETIDNGYRIVGQNEDGLPKPEFHFVGDDATLIATAAGPWVVYQDATTHELLLAQRTGDNTWNRVPIAGAEATFVGAYGFFASASTTATDLVVSTWVIDQPNDDQWVEVFRRPLIVQ